MTEMIDRQFYENMADRCEKAEDRIAELELALAQIRSGCVDDGDEALAYWKLSPGEIRKIVNSVL